MPTDPLRVKALKCLRERRVTIYNVELDERWHPIVVLARVRSSQDRHPYKVQFRDDGWSCDCRGGLRGDPCPHAHAVALVTTLAAVA